MAILGGAVLFGQTPSYAGGTGLLSFSPAPADIVLDESGDVTLQFSDLSGIYGVDIRLAFDGAVVQVVDANPDSGVQISPGTCPAPDFVLTNQADNTAGTIDYVAVQLNPTPPCGSGFILQIEFSCIALGSSPITFTSSLISDSGGAALAHTSQAGLVNCVPPPPLPVGGVVIGLAGGDVNLSWTPVTEDTHGNPINVTQYIVHRSTTPYFTPQAGTIIGTTGSTFFSDPGAAGDPALNYYYGIQAESDTGQIGAVAGRVGEFDFALLPGGP